MMNFHVMTLFPDMVKNGLETSITGRAMNAGLFGLDVVNIRDYTRDKHNHVDDAPYGGGAGMVMQAEPVYLAYEAIRERIPGDHRVIYVTPQGKTFNQDDAKLLAKEEDIVFLCGHYEGVDERVLDMIVTDRYSIGDYVLTGGELPVMVMIDCISRLIPGVLHNDDSSVYESFNENLLEYPQYTRPPEFMGRRVPDVLLSGHHANVEKWRRQKSLLLTAKVRPELLREASLDKKDRKFLRENGFDLENFCMKPQEEE